MYYLCIVKQKQCPKVTGESVMSRAYKNSHMNTRHYFKISDDFTNFEYVSTDGKYDLRTIYGDTIAYALTHSEEPLLVSVCIQIDKHYYATCRRFNELRLSIS